MKKPASPAQTDPEWDNTTANEWPESCVELEFPSTVDGKMQPAFFYKSTGNQPRPLLISLHTWSFDYQQEDPLSWLAIEKNINYIHPNFRGVNNTFEACGSTLVSSDIDDAISYAVENGNVDTDNIHVIGVSGGGHATLLTYMKSIHDIASFSAWVPITNFVDWYKESEGRKAKYSRSLAQSTTGLSFANEAYYLGVEEAQRRSVINMPTPVQKRGSSQLNIYAGVHDGYTGSVPITHSLNMFNKLVRDFDNKEQDALISTADMFEMLAARCFSNHGQTVLGDRIIHYHKNFEDLVKLTIFEGGHELLVDIALDHIPD